LIIVSPNFFKVFIRKDFVGIALWPFIIFQNEESKKDKVILNHEKIHLRQQIEMLVFFFYLWYLLEFLYHLIKTKNHLTAYRKISFEKEAYAMEKDMNYLKGRKIWSFLNYLES